MSREREDAAEEPKEWEKPGRSPTISCLFLTLVPLGLLAMAVYNTAEMVWRGIYDNWGGVVAPLVVLMGFPVVGVLVLLANRKMLRQAAEEAERLSNAEDEPSDPRP